MGFRTDINSQTGTYKKYKLIASSQYEVMLIKYQTKDILNKLDHVAIYQFSQKYHPNSLPHKVCLQN